MWHDNSFAQDNIRESFAVFVEQDLEAIVRRRPLSNGGAPLTFMDILQMWLEEGNGLDVCATFESFLLATIVIIDSWIAGDRMTFDGVPLWPTNAGVRLELFWSGDSHPSYNFGDTHHPVLQRENFLYLQHRWQTAQQGALLEQVGEIAASLSKAETN